MATNETPFRRELRENIERTVRALRGDGTTTMSVDNLLQCTPTPKVTDGAPNAKDAPGKYRAIFIEVCDESKVIKSFLL